MGISPNRLVAVLTPLVFAPLAGAISVFAAEHIPGLDIDSGQLQQVFIAGALIAFGKAGLWLKGWQDWEKTQNAVPEDVANDIALAAAIEPAAAEPESDDDPALAGEDPDMELDDDDEDEDPDDDGEFQPDDNGFAAIGTD
jgi:hypothetical protein